MTEPIDNLIVKYLSENTTHKEEETLLAWLEESDENKQHFRSIKDVFDLHGIEACLKDSRVDLQWKKFTARVHASRRGKPGRQIRLQLLRYAAVFILGLLCYQSILFLKGNENAGIAQTKIETAIGDRSKITLPDGSTVWINACSSISYDNTFNKKERAVSLEGEAFFDVKTDTLIPFLVKVDKLTLRVTGTSFNVYSFHDEKQDNIALLTGSVTVEQGQKKEQLHPGEILIYDKQTGKTEKKKIDVEVFASWRYGELVFDNITFEELARRLERNFKVKFIFENQHIKKESFGGSFRGYESLDTMLKVISTSTPMHYRIDKDKVYIN